jgi:ABC-type transporter MlaC component
MRLIARQYLLGLGLMAALLAVPAIALAQDAPAAAPASPAPATPAKPTPPKPAPVKATAKKPPPAAKVAAHPAKPTPSPVKKVAATPKKPAPAPAKKLAATPKPSTPPKTVAAAPKPAEPAPSYTITTTRNNVTYTTRVVPVAGSAPPAPRQVASAPATPPPANPQPAELPAPRPVPPPAAATSPAAATPAPAQPVPASAETAPRPPAATPASAFVSRFLTDAFNIARENGVSSLQRRAQLADLFAARMDIPRIAGYTAGDELASVPPEVQRRFQAILISYLVETYYPRIALASDPTVSVQTVPAPALADGTDAVWTTFDKSAWTPQSVKWHLQRSGDTFKIVDIFSAGASLAQMERDTFVSVMRNGGLPELMTKLDARTKALASAAP